VLDHVSYAVEDLERSARSYDPALAPHGYVRVWSLADAIGYGVAGGDDRFAIKARAGLALLAAVLVGCVSGPGPPAVLDDGASLWRRVETEHFVVESNLADPGEVRRVARDFETLWHAFASVPILGLRPPDAKPVVALLRDPDEYRYLAGEQSAGMFVRATALGPMIVLPPSTGPFGQTVVKHELAHFVSSEFLPDAPRWLVEGLAQVMETATYDPARGEVLFGDYSHGLLDDAALPLPAARLVAPWPAAPDDVELRAYYGRSWLLVHYLVDEHLQPFLDFLVRIASGTEWRAAWAQELPLGLLDVDARLDAYYERGKYGLWTVVAHVPDAATLEVGPVPPADALALRCVLLVQASVRRGDGGRRRDAERDLEEALELDPRNARARRVRTALRAGAP